MLIIFLYRKKISHDLIKRGLILGGLLGLNLITAASALNYTTATNTAFFPAICGIVAAFYAWGFQQQKVAWVTWLASLLSVFGALLLIFEKTNLTHQWLGDLLAFVAPLFYAAYIFRLDYDTKTREIFSLWPLLGIELVAMWVLCVLGTAMLGTGFSIANLQFKDYGVVIYVGLITTLLPATVSIFFQRYLSPISVAFIFILEPIWGAIIAALYLGEKLSLRGYVGGCLIVLASLINTLASLKSNQAKDPAAQC